MKPNAAIAWSGLAVLTLVTASAQPQPGWTPALSPIENAVENYAKLSGRVMLHGRLPSAEGVTFPETQSVDREQTIRALQAAFLNCGLELEHRGEKFAVLLPKERRELEACPAWQALRVPSNGHRESATNQMWFPSVDLNTALDFFGAFSGRTILRATGLPAMTVSLAVGTPLTRAELIYAFRVMLALHGVAMMPDGEHFEIVVALQQVALVKPGAPAPKPGERVYQPEELPTFALNAPGWGKARPGASRTTFGDELKAQYDRLSRELGIKPKSPLDRMLHFYTTLSGQRWVPSQIPFLTVSFVPQGPLTKAELFYALETTLALNGFYVAPVDKGSFRLVDPNEARHLKLISPPFLLAPASLTR